MAIGHQSKKNRATYTLSAAALTIAALTLTGCGQLAAQGPSGTGSGAASGSGVQASELKPATAAAAPKAAATDTSAAAPAAEAQAAGAPAAEAQAAEAPAAAAGQPVMGLQAQGSVAATAVAATASRTALVAGSYKPDASTTGVPSGKTLTKVGTYDKPYVINVDGTVLDGKEIFGDVKIEAKNVVIRNSLLRCGNYKPSTNTGCIDANSAKVFNLAVEDSTINPILPSPLRDGIVGHEYTALRNHVYGTNDGMGVFNKPGGSVNANVRIEGNYIHTTVYHDAANDPGPAADGTHNDGIQVQGGTNIRIAGNTIANDGVLGAGSKADATKPRLLPHGHGCTIILQNNTGAPLKNTVVEQNWLDDGLASACIKPGEITFQKNRFGQNQYNYFALPKVSKYVIRIDVKATTIVHGLETNIWESTGQPLKVGKGLGIEYNS
jgi:hypothetical protein